MMWSCFSSRVGISWSRVCTVSGAGAFLSGPLPSGTLSTLARGPPAVRGVHARVKTVSVLPLKVLALCATTRKRIPALLSVLPKQVFVAGHNRDALPAPRSSHVEQLFPHAISGDDNGIDRFPLTAVGSDSVAVCELLVILRQSATILQMNAALLINPGDRDQFAIGGAKTRLAPICHQQQLVVGSNFDGATLIDFKALRLLCRELAFFAVCVAGNDLAVFHSEDFQRFMPSTALDRPVKFQHSAPTIVPHVTFLCGCPVQR